MQRAQIVRACGAGETNTAIAKRMGLTGMTVGKWRNRSRELGLVGLHEELRLGRTRTYEDEEVAEVITRALQGMQTDCSTHWSARALATAMGSTKPLFTSRCRPSRCSPAGRNLTTFQPNGYKLADVN